MDYLNPFVALITHHPRLAYGAIFLISFSESLALVGLLVPGTVIMFGVGAIVSTGSLGLTPVLLLATAGAIVGDGVSYWLGHHYRERLVGIWPFSRYREMLKKGERFFHRHGGKSVLFGRFVGPVRPVIPVVAGMLGMGPVHFSVVNVLSAIGWALVYILPGVFFGTSLAVAGVVSTRLAVLVCILVVSIWSFIWLCRKTASLFQRKGPAWLSALEDWAVADAPIHGLLLPAKRFLSFLFCHRQGEELMLAFLILVLVAAGWGFLGVLQDVLAKDPLVVADHAVYHFFQALRTPWADSAFVAITGLADPSVIVFLTVAVLCVLLVKRCHRAAGFWAVTTLGGLLMVQLLKSALQLPRPVAIYQGAAAYGFPSGHTTMSVILYGFLAILLARRLKGVWRWGLFSSVVAISVVIGFSRLYLGAHWLSDVLGGLLIGATWAALFGIAYLKGPPEAIPRRLLGFVAILAMLMAGGWHVTQHHERALAFYAPRHTVRSMPLATWQADGWRGLSAWRVDMAGEQEQPLTVQWAGSPDALVRFLMHKGWQRPLSLNLGSLFGMFAPDSPVASLPSLPRLHDGRAERLRLVLVKADERFVLRLWSADATIDGNDGPLLVGTIEAQRRWSLAGLLTMARDTGEYERSLDVLRQALGDGFTTRLVRRSDYEAGVGRMRWGGGVLLVWDNEILSSN